jgi:hypothetical protein
MLSRNLQLLSVTCHCKTEQEQHCSPKNSTLHAIFSLKLALSGMHQLIFIRSVAGEQARCNSSAALSSRRSICSGATSPHCCQMAAGVQDRDEPLTLFRLLNERRLLKLSER